MDYRRRMEVHVALGKAELVTLGLLAGAPAYGYELLERARSRGMDAWMDVGRASIYQALERMECRGLVQGKTQEGAAGPDRRVHRLTRAGRARLTEEVEVRLARPGPYETSAGTALGFVGALAGGAQGLDAYREALRARREALRAASVPEDRVAAAMVARQVALLEADLAWLAAHRRTLTKGG